MEGQGTKRKNEVELPGKTTKSNYVVRQKLKLHGNSLALERERRGSVKVVFWSKGETAVRCPWEKEKKKKVDISGRRERSTKHPPIEESGDHRSMRGRQN